MSAALGVDAGESVDHALMLAYRALDEGDSQSARGLAQSVLLAGKTSANESVEARALACLAHCDRVGSRLRRASDTSRRAAQMFERLGEPEGEAMALATLSHSCMLLGRNDEAVESALLCVRLCELRGPSPQGVLAHNTLGVAYGWSGNFDRADAAMERAVQVAGLCSPAVSPYQVRVNQAWVEATRLVDERYRCGSMQGLAHMSGLVKECRRLEDSGDGAAVVAGLQSTSQTMSFVMTALLGSWQGRIEVAHVANELALRSLRGAVTWVDALLRWSVAEVAWARKDWALARQSLVEMKGMALSAEYEQLACLAHLLLAQVLELQGEGEAARYELRELRTRERRMARESLAGREAVVDWRLDARRNERHLRQALLASKQFERWSLEDALTGLANRRCLEQSLEERLQAAVATGRPLAVAMIDVDRFKHVNDTYTHQVGDRVLKTLAALMCSHVRENDLPARWAGDEFVILFSDADVEAAARVCDRLQAAIRTFDWDSIAAGLQMSVSIGLSEARQGDSIESMLQRSDESMYESKSMGLPHA